MAKITRAELARRRRVELYKKIIVYGFLILTILPIFTSIFLFHKVNELEKKLDYALSEEGGDYLTLRSSREALLSNPNAESGVFEDSVKSVLGNTNVDTNNAKNTENTEGGKALEAVQAETQISKGTAEDMTDAGTRMLQRRQMQHRWRKQNGCI